MTQSRKSQRALNGEDAIFLTTESPQYFGLLKRLWIGSTGYSKCDVIVEKYGVASISNGLKFKEHIAVKGVLSVLMYLSRPDSDSSETFIDFFCEEFYDNIVHVLNDTSYNDLYIKVARLIRSLQLHKGFADWLRTKGETLQDNKLWRRLEFLSHHGDEETRHEYARTVKEGMRKYSTEDLKKYVWRVTPEDDLERLRNEELFRITDEDIQRLDELSQSDGAGGDDDIERLRILEAQNLKLKKESAQKLGVLEKDLEEERNGNERAKSELSKTAQALKEQNEKLILKSYGRPAVADEPSESSRQLVESLKARVGEVQRDLTEVWTLTANLPATGTECAENVRILADENSGISKEIKVVQNQFTVALKDNLLYHKNVLRKALVEAGGQASLAMTYAGQPGRSGMSASQAFAGTQASSRDFNFPPPVSPVMSMTTRDDSLPPEWTKKLDPKTSHYYYINRNTGDVQWTAPKA